MAGIIKAGKLESSGAEVSHVAFNFGDMTAKADGYLNQVREQAKKILLEAKAEAATIRSRAEQEGQEAAIEHARANLRGELEQRLLTLLPALQKAVASIELERQAWRKKWNEKVVQLSVAIAEKIVRRELASNPSISLDLIRESLELAAGGDRIRLHLNPTDLETLGEQVQRLTDELEQLGAADIIGDPNISLGGCKVLTEYGSIDQQLETQLKRIEQELTS